MIWRGETQMMRFNRIEKWHRVFAWFPEQMDSGHWVWLAWYWARCSRSHDGWSRQVQRPDGVSE